MATINDLVKKSFRKLGVLGIGEDLENDQLVEGIEYVNRMIEVWNTENLVPFYIQREDFTLVSGTQSYTIGSGGTFNTTRPQDIITATITENGSTYPMEIITAEEWQNIFNKENESNKPYYLYYEANYPLGTIYLYRKPTAANTLTIASHKQIGSFAKDDSVSLPPGYEKAIIDNLALELWPMYPSESVYPVLDRQAKNSLEQLRRNNTSKNFQPIDIDYRAYAGRSKASGYFWGE
jgi:hypothetical protein